MTAITRVLQTWQKLGIYGRLYLPILVIILVFTGVRYSLLIETSSADIHARSVRELRELSHYLLPQLSQLSTSGQTDHLIELLTTELYANPEVASLRWQAPGVSVEVPNPEVPVAQYPPWLLRWVTVQEREMVYPATQMGEGGGATLAIRPSSVAAVNGVWRTLVAQAKISLAIVFTIFFLLTLILRSNEAMLRRLALATDQFKSGDYAARMAVTGTREARAVASTFNAMAQELQVAVQSLRESERRQSEQLHFTLQLINAFPVPMIVEDSAGVCTRLNTAWEKLFHMGAGELLGQPMRAIFNRAKIDVSRNTASGAALFSGNPELDLRVHSPGGQVIDAICYRAAFTTVDGQPAGTISAIVDITQRKLAQAALMAEKERAEVTLSSIGDAVVTTDLNWRIETFNTVAQQLTGWTREQAVGQELGSVFELVEHPGEPSHGPVWSDVLSSKTVAHGVNQVLISQTGQHFSIEYTASPIATADGTCMGCVLVFRDVSEMRHLIQRIDWLSHHDGLTGLDNRAGLAEQFRRAIYRARYMGCLQAVCLVDLDHFQQINDRLGATGGDHVLMEVAHRLNQAIDGDDCVARLGGDEFVVLIGGQSEVAAIEQIAGRMLTDLAQPYVVGGATVHLTASMGISIYPDDDVDPDTLLRHADQALYQAKQKGRNCSHLFDANLDKEVETHHNQRTRIRQALKDGELRLHYQPKVNMRTGQVSGMEALLRWQHPESGLLGPAHFLPVVENDDLIIPIGQWVMQEALHQQRYWLAQGVRWPISVNIAARHFQLPDFVLQLKAVLAEFPDVPPELLEIEILESAALDDLQQVRQVMQECQALGVQFALDDFGTGYSSLAYLKRLPANTLKIDQTFVRDMQGNRDDLALVSAMIGLARVFNRHIVAEGVETAAHGELLIKLGCDHAQGYGIARPMPAESVLPWSLGFTPAPNWALAAQMAESDLAFNA